MSIAWCMLSVSMPEHITLDTFGKKESLWKIDYSSWNKSGQKVKKHREKKSTDKSQMQATMQTDTFNKPKTGNVVSK